MQVTLNGRRTRQRESACSILDDGSKNGELSSQIAGTNNNFAVSNFDVKRTMSTTGAAGTTIRTVSTQRTVERSGEGRGNIHRDPVKDGAEENYYLTAKYVEYEESKPYQLDLSQVKWGYLWEDENGRRSRSSIIRRVRCSMKKDESER